MVWVLEATTPVVMVSFPEPNVIVWAVVSVTVTVLFAVDAVKVTTPVILFVEATVMSVEPVKVILFTTAPTAERVFASVPWLLTVTVS